MNYPIDLSNIQIKTNRLLLRPFKQEDLNDLYEYARIDGVGQMAGWPPHKNIDESQIILSLFIKQKKTLAIVYNNKVIGSIGVEEYNQSDIPELNNLKAREIGYVLSKDYWGQGLIPEAVNGVINYLFNEVKLDAIVCCYFLFNNQSKRVQEKCGFKFLRNTIIKDQLGKDQKTAINIKYKKTQ